MTYPMNDNRTHGTGCEMNFLDGLGKHCEHWNDKLGRLELLKRYQRAMHKRTRWGSINRVEIGVHVVASIEREVVLR